MFAFTLPYDQGERVEKCIIRLKWQRGPVGETELDHNRELHSHLSYREETFDPYENGEIAVVHEEIEEKKQPEKEDERQASKQVVQKVYYPYLLQNLLPGTDYKVKW